MVDVAQSEEHLFVAQEAAGSMPAIHPSFKGKSLRLDPVVWSSDKLAQGEAFGGDSSPLWSRAERAPRSGDSAPPLPEASGATA
jgi:hypothetical protein